MPDKLTPGNGPYLTTVLFCEKVLREVGDIPSVIRIIDHVTVVGKSEKMEKATLDILLFLLMKGGNFRGEAKVSIEPVTPSGEHLNKLTFPLEFQEGPRSGVAAEIPIQLNVSETGPYWWNILFEDQLIARASIEVLYRQIQQQQLDPVLKDRNI